MSSVGFKFLFSWTSCSNSSTCVPLMKLVSCTTFCMAASISVFKAAYCAFRSRNCINDSPLWLFCAGTHSLGCRPGPGCHGKLEGAVIRAKAEGCDAVIGGYAANLCAEKAGLPAVIVRTGEETIQQAMNEAVRTVERVRQERIIAQMYKTIIYSSKEGILYVDAGGNIQVRNRVIREMAGNISLMDKPLKKAIPLLYEGFQESVSTGQEISGKIYTFSKTKTTISAEFIPVVVGDEISGVVINVSDITKIQELEGRIRRKLSEKGLSAKYTFEDVVHESKIMEDTIEEAKQYAASDANISIVGETGTGKELFAQSIHNASPRKNGPFVAINCAALPENLLESELFGYVEGAFTGTSKGGKMGLFEQAHGGNFPCPQGASNFYLSRK